MTNIQNLIIIGGGAAGLSCALVIGSGLKKPFAANKQVTLIAHQKSSQLQNALFNNVLGMAPRTLGKDILNDSIKHLEETYPEVHQVHNEKVCEITDEGDYFNVITNKTTYQSKMVVIALNYTKPFSIKGLSQYEIPHTRANIEKDRVQLKNEDHLIKKGLYVCGTLAGWRSQFSIAAGSGAQVATDILTVWNNGKHTKVHDKISTL